MSTPLQQIAIAVVTAGCVSFASAAFYAGQQDKQIQNNTNDIAKNTLASSKIPVIEANQLAMGRRLDTYEKLTIDGQKEILKEMSGLTVLFARSDERIGAIETDVKEINEKIDN